MVRKIVISIFCINLTYTHVIFFQKIKNFFTILLFIKRFYYYKDKKYYFYKSLIICFLAIT